MAYRRKTGTASGRIPSFPPAPAPNAPAGRSTALNAGAFLGRSHRAKAPKAALDGGHHPLARHPRPARRLETRHPARLRYRRVRSRHVERCSAQRGVDVLSFESFSEGWATDAVKQLKIDTRVLTAPYGQAPPSGRRSISTRDVVLCWNGTTSGVKLADGRFHPRRSRGPGAVRCHVGRLRDGPAVRQTRRRSPGPGRKCWAAKQPTACSPFPRALSPASRSYKPAWPLPKIFRLTKGGKLIDGIFAGETINTPSACCAWKMPWMACAWAESIGGLPGLIARTEANLAAISANG